MRKIRLAGLMAVMLFLCGCFPIELDVSSDGRILIPRQEGFLTLDPASGKVEVLYKPDAGTPIFGLFAPDGKQILAVTEAGSGAAMGGMGKSFDFWMVDLASRNARKLYTAGNATYAQFSPDGKYLSVSQLAGSPKPPLKEQLPELYVVNLEDGSSRLLVSNVSSIHRWLPDSKSLLVFSIAGKEEGKSYYSGSLEIINLRSGAKKILLDAIGDNNLFLDVHADGKRALFTARSAGKHGAKLEGEKVKLYELTLGSGEAIERQEGVRYALFSPKGDRVLLGLSAENNRLKIEVSDASFANSRLVSDQVTETAGGGFGNQVAIYPGWIGNESLFYLGQRAVYGVDGKNLELVVANVGGSERRAYQGEIEAEAAKSEEAGWKPSPVSLPPAGRFDFLQGKGRTLMIAAASAIFLAGLVFGRLFFSRK